MSTDTTPLVGEPLLDAVTSSMRALHERYFHRRPVTARTQLIDGEMLACVMRDVYTDVEKTLIELDRADQVRDTRNNFQWARQATFIDEVQRLSGRRVVTFVSDSHVGPDLQLELFLLEPLG